MRYSLKVRYYDVFDSLVRNKQLLLAQAGLKSKSIPNSFIIAPSLPYI
jgi:hypothetical protein